MYVQAQAKDACDLSYDRFINSPSPITTGNSMKLRIILVLLLLSLSGCLFIESNQRVRYVTDEDGHVKKQITNCLYWTLCGNYQDADKPITAAPSPSQRTGAIASEKGE